MKRWCQSRAKARGQAYRRISSRPISSQHVEVVVAQVLEHHALDAHGLDTVAQHAISTSDPASPGGVVGEAGRP